MLLSSWVGDEGHIFFMTLSSFFSLACCSLGLQVCSTCLEEKLVEKLLRLSFQGHFSLFSLHRSFWKTLLYHSCCLMSHHIVVFSRFLCFPAVFGYISFNSRDCVDICIWNCVLSLLVGLLHDLNVDKKSTFVLYVINQWCAITVIACWKSLHTLSNILFSQKTCKQVWRLHEPHWGPNARIPVSDW